MAWLLAATMTGLARVQTQRGGCDRAQLTSPHIGMSGLENLSLRGIQVRHGMRIRSTDAGGHPPYE